MFIPSHTSSSTNHYPSIPHPSLLSRSNEPGCGFVGNNDIYGVGIRIGIYSQMLAVWFANYFLSSEVQSLRDSVSIFGLAVLVVSVLFAIHPEDVYAVEAFIVLQILAWSCLMAVQAKSSYAAVNLRRRTVVRKVANHSVNLFMVALHIWFWWKGLDEMKRTPCGTWMMYIIKTDLYGWARSVMKALSVFVGVMTVYWVGVEYATLYFSVRMGKVRDEFSKTLSTWKEMEAKSKANTLDKGTPSAENASMHDACFLLTPSSTPVGCPEIVPDSPEVSTIINLLNGSPLPEYAILRQVYESELYITHCIAATPFERSENEKPLPLLTMMRYIFSPAKHHTPESKLSATTSPAWLECQWRLFQAVLTFRFPARSFCVYTYLQQTYLLDPLNGPFQVLASMTYAPSSSTTNPTWQTTTLASSLLLASPSAPKKVKLGWFYMLIDLFVHIFVILQLELTLVWNHIDGLSGLWTSVGQLIPFIIGVSGLTLVLGRWIGRRWEKRCQRRGLGKKEGVLEVEVDERNLFGLSEEVMESYGRWKAEFEASMRKLQVASM